MQRKALRLEVVLVVLVSALVLVPGIGSYSLVDPWETHYGEVAREMLQDHDLVHMHWNGTFYSNLTDNEGFRSKPVLPFWMMAAGLRAVGVAADGGYSGEMVEGARTMVGIRLPFVLCAIAGLALMWWVLARLVSRRVAWLGLLVVGSTPMFCLISRQAIPDMPLCATTMGAIALFIMAVEDGDRPITTVARLFKRKLPVTALHVVVVLAGAFVLWQAAYYAIYFIKSPTIAIRARMPSPALWLPLLTLLLFGGLSRDGWLIARLPAVLVGGIIAAILNEPMPYRQPGQSWWRHVFDDILGVWDRHALDRYLLAVLPVTQLAVIVTANLVQHIPLAQNAVMIFVLGVIVFFWGRAFLKGGWRGVWSIVDHLMAMQPITTMRQVYLLASYALVGVSVLAKGPPGLTVVAGIAAFHVILNWRWRELYGGGFEIKRSLLMTCAVALPWHIGMWLKDGVQFVDQYLFQHILNRAGDGSVDKSFGTFASLSTGGGGYMSQLGHGMWIWAALLPAALAVAFVRANRETREGRVRFLVGVWAIVSIFVFCFVQTKFHHYILPAVPALGLLVAFYLDDLLARRERLPAIFAVIAVGITLLVARDLMHEPERWIEMFVYRYDRPWPNLEPYQVDPSDGILALGIAGVVAILVTTRLPRLGVALMGGVGLAICVWALQSYMPVAGKHWGMREAMRTYFEQRTVYGQIRAFYSAGQCAGLDVASTYRFDTFLPDNLQLGQPMTLDVRLYKTDQKTIDQQVEAHGTVTKLGHHTVTFELFPGERDKLTAFRADCAKRARTEKPQAVRPPLEVVDADRLIAWQLYWRGENFWSNDEIWGFLPEMKTSFVPANNTELQKYLGDRTRSPLGRRYFVITEASRINGFSQLAPTSRAHDTYEVLDTTSNKFSIAAFYL